MCQQANVVKFSELYVEWFDNLYLNFLDIVQRNCKIKLASEVRFKNFGFYYSLW